jgi:hypothetical protein
LIENNERNFLKGMIVKKLVLLIAILALTAAPVMANATFSDGGAQLQGILNSHTAPYPGVSSVNVLTDNIANDSYWKIQASGGSVTTLVLSVAAAATAGDTFGVYDMANPTHRVQLFSSTATIGTQDTLSILADGSVRVNGVDSGIDFAGNAFGYYVNSAGGLWSSDTALNSDGMDHMYAYQGKGDTFQVSPYAPGKWSSQEFILAFEDSSGQTPALSRALAMTASVGNYSDMVVMVESVGPVVPAPGAILLAGIGTSLVGWMRRRRAF